MADTKFKVVRGTEQKIKEMPQMNGYVYFTTDSGRIYMDTATMNKIPMGGGNGVVIHYGQNIDAIDPEEKDTYVITSENFVDLKTTPQVGDLILDTKGSFYKITDMDEETYTCVRISISGGGSSDGSGVSQGLGLSAVRKTDTNIVLNGQSVPVQITATSAKDSAGNDIDEEIDINYSIALVENGSVTTTYVPDTRLATIKSGATFNYDFGSLLRESAESKIIITARSDNYGKTVTRSVGITCAELTLTQSSNFTNANAFTSNSQLELKCNVNGNLDKILDISFDDEIVATYNLTASSIQEQGYVIPANDARLTHGAHTVKFEVYQDINVSEHVRGETAKTLSMEIAVVDTTSEVPVIWLDDYATEYKTYDDIQIPFRVYDCGKDSTTVYFYKNNQAINDGYTISLTGSTAQIFEIADATENATNYYSIGCGVLENEVRRDIIFTVVQDTEHSMVNPQANALTINFDAKGRSNNENASQRATWTNPIEGNPILGVFEDFNWSNNGWKMENYQTGLKISNGASFSIPLGSLTFQGNENPNISHSFDFQFKVSNIQDYSSLIKTVTRYTNDEVFWKDYQANYATTYDSYDSYLTQKLPATNDAGQEVSYDDLEYNRVDKIISLENAVCSYFDQVGEGIIRGLAIGPQDVFFSNGTNTISAEFVENKMIYLTIVYDGAATDADGKNAPMIYIYVNGVLTGVLKSTALNTFTINQTSMVFNSNACDIDLYKVRCYNTALTVNDVVMNYAVDTKDITTYDQNGLAEYKSALGEYRLSYQKMLQYNENHPKDPLMPYVIFDTTPANNDDRLSFSKKTDVTINMEFHNPALELAYKNGELEDLAIEDGLLAKTDKTDSAKKEAAVKLYYLHHCPSFRAENVNMAVQGTSSEFYPRRNYKIKTKTKLDSDKTERVHIWIMGGPYAAEYAEHGTTRDTDSYTNPCHSDWFYMNNYTNGTTKFTMKVDFMESSGSYNMGLANAVYNAYSKHPLEDYIKAEYVADETTGEKKTAIEDTKGELVSIIPTDVMAEDSTKQLRWADYRTSVQGFPVMAFHKYSTPNKFDEEVVFIGLYRMLLDKGSDEVYGFKPGKKVLQNALGGKKVRDIAECWEFSDNNRTYCSYRDPWNREELSFRPPEKITIKKDGVDVEVDYATDKATYCQNVYTAAGAPLVADSFEYRYSKYGDALDVVYDLTDKYGSEFTGFSTAQAEDGSYTDDNTAELKDAFGDDFDVTTLTGIHEGLYQAYQNWEKACAWVWLTNTDNVISGATYKVLTGEDALGDTVYENNKYYVKTETGGYTKAAGYKYGTDYYILTEDGEYQGVKLVDEAHKYVPSKYYIHTVENKVDSYSLATGDFDSSAEYCEYVALTNEDIEAKIASGEAKHTKKLTERYTTNKYPGYLTSDGYATWDTNKKYLYDTKEFREEKFVNELAKHFDIEYLATYFVITEVLECYDSRGKNCMMASWGPQTPTGDYIWYPIFYDMDTQLGINNTGIPSFSYNVDATDDGNFSTSDSLLWNNFYRSFKTTAILNKYKHLKGVNQSSWDKLDVPIFSSVSMLESWYKADPDQCNSIAMRGERPLIATNLDEFYKYITITNKKGLDSSNTSSSRVNLSGYQSSSAESGKYTYDATGKYFYALQGDRSLSRQQFLTNRFEYIDSWLNQGDYQRSGSNCAWGRIRANMASVSSDIWIDDGTDDKSYWLNKTEFGKKRYDFDAQYWVTLKPIRNTYVTVGGDSNTVYPSQKYTGTPINYKINEVESAVKSSELNEKLLYIYGMNQMASAGDLYKNYWTEFRIDGNADKLSSLLLGCDGLMYNNDTDELLLDENGDVAVSVADDGRILANADSTVAQKAHKWYNNGCNPIGLPSENGLPLLIEANLSNIQFQSDQVIDLSKSPKLQNFRATNTNLTQVNFADGVALNTLYLGNTLTRFTLAQASNLNNIIEEYSYPRRINGEYVAEEGLYIQGLTDRKDTDVTTSNISYLSIKDDALGYDSYKLLKKYYKARFSVSGDTQIELTNVKWSPYTLVTEGDTYQAARKYFKDNDHYGLEAYTFTSSEQFDNDVANGELYILDEDFDLSAYVIDEEAYAMLVDMVDTYKWKGVSTSSACPNITGILYINNVSAIDEISIYNKLTINYPNLTVFFNADKINKTYTAKFILPDLDDDGIEYLGTYSYVKRSDGKSGKSIQKVSDLSDLKNPYEVYSAEKANYDFSTWSTSMTSEGKITEDGWSTLIDTYKASEDLNKDATFTFYALFTKHKYNCEFFRLASDTTATNSYAVPFGEFLNTGIGESTLENLSYVHPDELTLPVDETYRHIGFTLNDKKTIVTNAKQANLVDFATLLSVQDYKFYAVYQRTDVHDLVTDLNKFTVTDYNYIESGDYADHSYDIKGGVLLTPKSGVILTGKVTLPIKVNNKPVVAIGGFGRDTSSKITEQKISGIYWNSSDGDNPNLRLIGSNAFAYCGDSNNFVMFEFTSELRVIGANAFDHARLTSLEAINKFGTKPSILKEIGESAFSYGFATNTQTINEFCIPSSVIQIGNNGFVFPSGSSNTTHINVLKIGTKDNLSALNYCGKASYPGIRCSNKDYNKYIGKLQIYASLERQTDMNAFLTNGCIIGYSEASISDK